MALDRILVCFHKERRVIKCNRFDVVSGKLVQYMRMGLVQVPLTEKQLSSLCFPWAWARSSAMVQRQNKHNGQAGALLKQHRANMLSMRPGFQKF